MTQTTADACDNSDEIRREILKIEAEHFYTSEFHSEQRASWLLTIAFGMLAAVLSAFVQVYDKKINARAEPALIACAICLFLAILSALWAIWPLQGSQGRLSRAWRKASSKGSTPSGSGIAWWERHYAGHRRRAEIKVVRVVWTLTFLLAAVVSGLAAVVTNSDIL